MLSSSQAKSQNISMNGETSSGVVGSSHGANKHSGGLFGEMKEADRAAMARMHLKTGSGGSTTKWY